jgi:hypothetical protein
MLIKACLTANQEHKISLFIKSMGKDSSKNHAHSNSPAELQKFFERTVVLLEKLARGI